MRQGVAFGLVVPQMVGDARKFKVVALHTGMVAAGDKFAVFASPADKFVVEAVDRQRVVAEKTHIAGFDAFVFAVAVAADDFRRQAQTQGGSPFPDACAEARQGGQAAVFEQGSGTLFGQDDARTLYQTAFAGEFEVVGDKRRIEQHVAVYQDDVVGRGGRDGAVT